MHDAGSVVGAALLAWGLAWFFKRQTLGSIRPSGADPAGEAFSACLL